MQISRLYTHFIDAQDCAIQQAIKSGEILKEDYIRCTKFKKKNENRNRFEQGGINGSRNEKEKYCKLLKKLKR